MFQSVTERYWKELQDEDLRAFAKFCESYDNDADRLHLAGLGVTLGPSPVEHWRERQKARK